MSTAATTFSRLARAKVNLRLEVGPKTGMLHTMVSAVAALDLADVIRFSPAADGFAVRCEGLELAERDNLAWRAAHALGVQPPSVSVAIEKHIPTQAGLGGGSSDAAATIQGLALILTRNGAALPAQRLAKAAASVGSDVPSFLAGGLRIVSGTGEVVTPRPCPAPPWGVVLLRPAVGSSTGRAYELLDTAGVPHALEADATGAAGSVCDAFCAGDFERFLFLLHNDFTTIIERELPAVAHARQRLERAGAQGTILCGSGSCVAGFFGHRAAAIDGAQRIALDTGEWMSVTTFSVD